MRILAIDTATERCSVALRMDGRTIERSTDTPRGHAELILPMVESVLHEGGIRLSALDALAYGRGPGAFTGVRIAVGVAQGLAFGANLPTVGISDLAAVAQQVCGSAGRVLVCMDARMSEVYWSVFECAAAGLEDASDDGSQHSFLAQCVAPERVDSPAAVTAANIAVLAGTGFAAYPQLRALAPAAAVHDSALPRASDIARLAEVRLRAGYSEPPDKAEPVYLRDQVTFVKSPSGAA